MDFTKQAHSILEKILKDGDVVVDATMGNGFDTLFLSDAVGEKGRVFAFDVQELALKSTKVYLDKKAKHPENTKLILNSHEFIKEELLKENVENIRAATFNLGYLPRSDKSLTTKAESTLKAIRACLELADKSRFCLSVLCYIAHDNTSSEYLAVKEFFDTNFSSYESFRDENNDKSPVLLVFNIKNLKKNV